MTVRQHLCSVWWIVPSAISMFGAAAHSAESPDTTIASVVTTSSKPSRFLPGDSLTLILRDSSRVSGVFLDLGRVSPDEYRRRYDDWRRTSSDGTALPELGARIEMGTGRITGSGTLYFCGLGHDGVAVRKGNKPVYTVPYDGFTRMSVAGGRNIESKRLQAISRHPGTPLVTTVEIRGAADTVAVRADDVLSARSSATGSTDWTRRFTLSPASSPRTTAAIEVGALWANDPSDLGRVAHGIYGRASQTFATPRTGADFALGIVLDDDGNGGVAGMDLALCHTFPIGRAFGLAPRAGISLMFGGGAGLVSATVGTGAAVRLSRSFGLRTDYTYYRFLNCENCNYQAFSNLQLGPYWGF